MPIDKPHIGLSTIKWGHKSSLSKITVEVVLA